MTLPSAGQSPARTLKTRLLQGSRGPDVRKLEKKLSAEGLLKGPVDTFFDARTKAAVQKFERAQNWKADGVVGNRVWNRLLGDSAANIVKPPNAPTKDSARIKTVNINVKSNPLMSQDRVVHDVRKASRQGSLIGWNEISPDRYFNAIKQLGPEWGHYMPKDGNLRIPNPISWKKDVWEKLDSGFTQTHGGRAKVSPNRYITWVKLKHKQTGKTVVRMNTHLVSGAWSSPKPTTPWRRQMWNIHMNKMRDVVARFKKQGHAVIIGGDFNRDSYKVLGDKVAYDNKLKVGTRGKSTLDYLMHLRDDGLKKIKAGVQGGYASDHDAVIATYKLKK